MKKAIVFISFFVFFINSFAFNNQFVKKYAEDKVKEELHSQLEQKLGKDIPVETMLQTLDYIANGE
ncbi:hypothetical protein, partial [Nautilia sp.]